MRSQFTHLAGRVISDRENQTKECTAKIVSLVTSYEQEELSGPQRTLVALELNNLNGEKDYLELMKVLEPVTIGIWEIFAAVERSSHPRLSAKSYALHAYCQDFNAASTAFKRLWRARRRFGHDQFLRRRSIVHHFTSVPFTQCIGGYNQLEGLAWSIATGHGDHLRWIASSTKTFKRYCQVVSESREAALAVKVLSEHEQDPRMRAFDSIYQPFIGIINGTTQIQSMYRGTQRMRHERSAFDGAREERYRMAQYIASSELTKWTKHFQETLTDLAFLLSHRLTNASGSEISKINRRKHSPLYRAGRSKLRD
ncbi:MAG: hypothetical protein M1836_003208 [Candelina mexicana]|nr:MAG: hypothetical protein M1836_003208 [Candelina mexicana]